MPDSSSPERLGFIKGDCSLMNISPLSLRSAIESRLKETTFGWAMGSPWAKLEDVDLEGAELGEVGGERGVEEDDMVKQGGVDTGAIRGFF